MVDEFFFRAPRHEISPEHAAIFRIGLRIFEDLYPSLRQLNVRARLTPQTVPDPVHL